MRLKRKPTEVVAHQWYPDISVEGVYTQPMPDMPLDVISLINNGRTKKGDAIPTPCAAVMTASNLYQVIESGDWVFPEPTREGRYYGVKPEVVEASYDVVDEAVEVSPNALDELIDLQRQLGYKPGEMNGVALLGLAGEVGEVLDELTISFGSKMSVIDTTFADSIMGFKQAAALLDQWKKDIRDGKYKPNVLVQIDEEKFDAELADQLYYAVALSVIRRRPLDYYFQLSINKVLKRREEEKHIIRI